MSYDLTQPEPVFDPLLAAQICRLSVSADDKSSVLVKIKLADELTPDSPLASLGLRVLVKAGHLLLGQRLICRQLRQDVKAALVGSGVEVATVKDHLGLVGAYTDFGLALEVFRMFITEVEAGNGRASISSGAGETQAEQQQHYLIITATIFNLTFTFTLDPVPTPLALPILERHFFAPIAGTFAASIALQSKFDSGRKGKPVTDVEVEAAVDASAIAARDEGTSGASTVLAEPKWRQAVFRWTAIASGAVGKDKLPRIADPPAVAQLEGPSAIELDSSGEDDQIDDHSTPSPPPPARPRRDRRQQPSRAKPRTSRAAQILDHNRRDLPGERISFDETQTQAASSSSSPNKRPGMNTGLSSQLEVSGLWRASRKGKGKDEGPTLVIVLESSQEEDDSEPATEPEPTPSPSPAEPDTDEDDGELPPSSFVVLPDPPGTQSQPVQRRSSLSSPSKSAASSTQRDQTQTLRSPTKPPWAVGRQPQIPPRPPASPTKRKAAEAVPRSASGSVAEAPADKRALLMRQRRAHQRKKAGGGG